MTEILYVGLARVLGLLPFMPERKASVALMMVRASLRPPVCRFMGTTVQNQCKESVISDFALYIASHKIFFSLIDVLIAEME